jgi:tocopherol cyclase
MFELIRSTLNPAGYHGWAFPAPFFEGWYFKIVDPTERYKFAIIPGLYKSGEPEKSHAFVQVMDGFSSKAFYQPYPIGQFQASKRGFELRLGSNFFDSAHMVLDMVAEGLILRGEIVFRNPVPQPWPVTFFSPGVMGWYAWVPWMECYHGVVSLDHGLEGALEIDGKPVDFSGGRGYIEKDWGKAFPSAWIWFQSNHFDQRGVCVSASIANIPWMGNSFAGFIVGVWVEGRLYRFTTYLGARIERLEVNDQYVFWRLASRDQALELKASRAAGNLLRAPTPMGLDRRIAETLDGLVDVRLWDRGGLIFSGVGRNAGLEIVGTLPGVGDYQSE